MLKTIFTTVCLLFYLSSTFSQRVSEPIVLKIADPYPMIRKTDVLWQKRIWREIDLSEKANKHLVLSMDGQSLFDILLNGIYSKYLTAYSIIDDRFSKELSIEQVSSILIDSSFASTINKQEKVSKTTTNKDIIKYWLKEDWFFNTRSSKIESRILGICPIRVKQSNEGLITGVKQLFWIYFPNARNLLNSYNAFIIEKDTNNYNIKFNYTDTTTFDDVFRKRKFSSFIINKSNVKNTDANNKTELDAFMKGQRSRRYYFNQEHDMWNY